jgi:hypothetical protein
VVHPESQAIERFLAPWRRRIAMSLVVN